MEYFYTPARCVAAPLLTIEGDEYRHLTHVMRMRAGDALRVVDGAGNTYDVVITTIGRASAECRITAHHVRLNEPSRPVILGAAVLKNPSRFDFLVEKSVELGVGTIVPLLTERTIPRHGNSERWRKLCIAAMKQSGRCVLPEVRALTPFAEFLASAPKDSARFIAHEQGPPATDIGSPGPAQEVVLCIGPEGGFGEGEAALAAQAGFATVVLGPRRLRAETAAITALAAVMRGDIRPASWLP
jgi:16S rRNA (uracil1498-N3)-methyltransferase